MKYSNFLYKNLNFFSFSYLIILFALLTKNCESKNISYIAVIPFKSYLPQDNNYPGKIMELIISMAFRKLYLDIPIESGQKLPMFLNFHQAIMHLREKIDYFGNIGHGTKAELQYTDNCKEICTYNFKNSNTFTPLSEFKKFYSTFSRIASEKMIFFKDLKCEKPSTYTLEFHQSSNDTNLCLLTGFLRTESLADLDVSWFHQIQNLIHSQKYSWALYFNNQNEGKFIIGDIIGNDELKFYNDNNEDNYIKLEHNAFGLTIFWKLDVLKLHIGNYVNELKKQFPIDINSKYITVTEELFEDIKTQYLINKGKDICFEEKASKYYKTIYCNKKKYLELTDNYKKLDNLVLFLNNVHENITFTPKDLFLEKDDYMYFFVRVDISPPIGEDEYENVEFSIGTILLEKYFTVFDDKEKTLYILKQKSNTSAEESEKDNTTLKIVLISVLSFVLCAVIFIVVGKLYGKQIFGLRRKKANELDDDNYDYTPGSINNQKKDDDSLLKDDEENGA